MHPITCHEIVRSEHRAYLTRRTTQRQEPWPRRDPGTGWWRHRPWSRA